MTYNKDGYRLEKYRYWDGEEYYRIRFEWMEEPLGGIVVDGRTQLFKTTEEAEKIAIQEIERRNKNDRNR